MEIPTFLQSTCEKRLADFRERFTRRSRLDAAARQQLLDEMRVFRDSLSITNCAIVGAGVGLGAALLPVIGWISGPLIGCGLCAYRAFSLSRYRTDVKRMIRALENS